MLLGSQPVVGAHAGRVGGAVGGGAAPGSVLMIEHRARVAVTEAVLGVPGDRAQVDVLPPDHVAGRPGASVGASGIAAAGPLGAAAKEHALTPLAPVPPGLATIAR